MSEGLIFEGGTITARINLNAYRLAAIKKAAYRTAERCTAMLGAVENGEVAITFSFKPGTPDAAAREAVRAFYQELLDQELREHIAEETAPVRTLILAHAFSKTDLIRRE